MVSMIGKFTLEKSENFDEFLKELGLNLLTRKAAALATPTVTISQEGDLWTLATSSTFSKSEIKFKLGEEFEEKRQDGVLVKSTLTRDGDKLVQVQKGQPDETTIVREFSEAGFTSVATVKGVACTRFYKRV